MTYSMFFKTINKIKNNDYEVGDLKNFRDSAKYLLECATKSNHIRDKFSFYYYDPSKIFECFLKSKKIESTYNLHFDSYTNEIVFYSQIRNWENIRNINDSFWIDFTMAAQELDFQFCPYGGLIYDKEKTPEFNSNYKSIIFKLMSVYITSMLEFKEQRDNISFGQMQITWTPGKSSGEIIKELNFAFKIFYKFNYILWKSEDIRTQNRNNRHKRKSTSKN